MALKSTSKKSARSSTTTKKVTSAKAATRKKPTVKAAAPKAKPVAAAPADDSQKITISFFAPEAGSVVVAGDFTMWETAPVTLVKEETGTWKTTLSLKPGKYQYRLLVDGQWQNDPQCLEHLPNDFGSTNCVLSIA